MGNTRDTGYLQNLLTYDASGNIVLPANLTVNGNLLVATQSYVTTQINNLIDGAPALLDTLDELAAALGDDANFASTVTTSIAGKQAQLDGTGFVKVTGTTVSYDNSTYLTTGTAGTTYVPYTGATKDVNLGAYSIATNGVLANQITVNPSGTTGAQVFLKHGSSFSLPSGFGSIGSANSNQFRLYQVSSEGVWKGANISLNSITSSTTRTYTLPDATGTFALTSDIPSVAGSYLPLSGGTLTGTLSVTNDGQILIGTTTAPNPVVGVKFPMSVTSAAATRIRIDSTQATPNSGFGLYANSVQKWSIAMFGTDSDFTIYNDALLSSAILVKGITSNVLIGYGVATADTGFKLDVNGTGRFTGALNGTSATFTGTALLGGASATNPLSIRTANGESYIRFLNADGTTYGDFERSITGSGAVRFTGAYFRFANQLEVTGAATFSSSITTSGNINVNSDGISINRSTSGEPYLFFKKDGVNRASIYGVTGGGLRIFDESDNQVLTMTGSMIGINKSLPSGTLDVQSSGANGIILSADSSDATNSGRLFFMRTGGEGFVIMNNAGNLSFRSNSVPGNTSGNERMRLDSSYNLTLNNGLTVAGATNHTGAVRMNNGTGGFSPRITFGTEDESVPGNKSIYLDNYWMILQPHVNEGLRVRFVNGSGSQTETVRFQSLQTTFYTSIVSTGNMTARNFSRNIKTWVPPGSTGSGASTTYNWADELAALAGNFDSAGYYRGFIRSGNGAHYYGYHFDILVGFQGYGANSLQYKVQNVVGAHSPWAGGCGFSAFDTIDDTSFVHRNNPCGEVLELFITKLGG